MEEKQVEVNENTTVDMDVEGTIDNDIGNKKSKKKKRMFARRKEKKTDLLKEKEKKEINNLDAIHTTINIISKSILEGKHCLALTSYGEKEGKTSIIRQIGRALAAAGYKTLIIDANINLPELSKVEGITTSKGFLDFIEIIQTNNGKISYGDMIPYIEQLEMNNLYFLSQMGNVNEKYTKYIKSESTKIIFETLKNKFEIILIEAPDLSHLSYAQSILENSDGYFLIIKEGQLAKKNSSVIKEQISKVKGTLMGAILNKVKSV